MMRPRLRKQRNILVAFILIFALTAALTSCGNGNKYNLTKEEKNEAKIDKPMLVSGAQVLLMNTSASSMFSGGDIIEIYVSGQYKPSTASTVWFLSENFMNDFFMKIYKDINPYLHSVEIDDIIQVPYSGGAKAHGQEQESQVQKEDSMGRA